MNTPAQDSSGRATHGPAAQTLEWVTRLISLDTTSRDSNLPVIEAIADHARELGLNVNLCPADGQPEKANLLVTVPAADGTVAGGVVLSGHSDVVPVDGQDWDSDPFAPEIRDGRLYGRGTCDMKGFIGVAVAALPKMAEAELTEPIHLAISFDEEVGCIGGAQIVKDIANLGLSPRACIVGEPSSMEVITAHKSINQIEVYFTGVAAHSSLTNQGVNSIEYAAKYISFVRQQADDWKAEGPFDEAYPVIYSTASVNVIHGGIAGNTVPADCKVLMEFRGLPEVDSPTQIEKFRRYAEELDHQMKAEQSEAGAEFVLIASVPGLETSVDADVVSLGAQLGGEPSQGKVTYGTEAGQFSGAGIETVVCGPGDIAQAHAANEFVDLDQLGRCEDFVSQLIQLLSKD